MKTTFDVPISLSLFIILLNHRGKKFSAENLSHTLQCSVRTIYRHVDVLTIAGVPVKTQRGRAGGVFGWTNPINSINEASKCFK